MSAFNLFALLVSLTALLSFLNRKWLRLPSTIGVMVSALLLSLALVGLSRLGVGIEGWAEAQLARIDFNVVLMQGMLSFLLFAGALHVDLSELLARKGTILTLATLGVVSSTALVGLAAWWLFGLFGIEMPLIHALVFGALITPTDPIAVLAVLKTAKVSDNLKAMIAGESLFNDGVGVVVFTALITFIGGGHGEALGAAGIARLFAVEALGGAVIGLGLGYVAYWMLRNLDDYITEVLITLALVMGGYSLAQQLHASGPIAMVVAGLFIGNHGRVFGMSERTREHVDTFWELVDEILNLVLFVFIGLELMVLELRPVYLAAAAALIPLTLAIRTLSVGVPLGVLGRFTAYPPYSIAMLSWSGVRGGISIALALSLPPSPYRDPILVAAYVIVIFSILVQGLTVGRLARFIVARS